MYEVIFNNNFIINFLISFIFIIFNYFFARLTADYLTNRGIISVNNFNPLINPPEVAILGIGRTSEEILIISGKQEIRKVCYFNLTFDHRAVDGFPASKFLESIIKNIQSPETLEKK